MTELITLDEQYSTTRRVIKADPTVIADAVKQSNKPEDKFETVLFLPEGEGRQGEGGLRTKGYFKVGGGIPDRHSGLDPESPNTATENTVIPANAGISSNQSHAITSANSHSREGGNITTQDQKPLITVVTVVYNGEKFLEETILSVINQTYDNVEYIIIDGGSTDGTLDIIKKYEHAIDYWVSEKDKGIYDAWNKAISACLGGWVSFLGADDTYENLSLEHYVVAALLNKDINYISSKVVLVKNSKKVREIGSEYLTEKLKKYMNFAHVGSLHSVFLFKKFGLFTLEYKITSDYDFFLRNINCINACFLNEVTANMNVGGVSDGSIRALSEAYKIRKYYGYTNWFSKLNYYFTVFKWLVRKKIWY